MDGSCSRKGGRPPKMIGAGALLSVLRNMLSRSVFVSDYARRSDGRVIRFIDWSRMARKRGGAR